MMPHVLQALMTLNMVHHVVRKWFPAHCMGICAVQATKAKEAQLTGALERATAAEELASKRAEDVQHTSEQVAKLEVCMPAHVN